MKNVGVAFDILENHQNVPVGWSKATGHLIRDVKMDFTRKARWVKDGHKTADPLSTNYAGVVSRDSVCITFTYDETHNSSNVTRCLYNWSNLNHYFLSNHINQSMCDQCVINT